MKLADRAIQLLTGLEILGLAYLVLEQERKLRIVEERLKEVHRTGRELRQKLRSI